MDTKIKTEEIEGIKNEKISVVSVLFHPRNEFIIIGLTGRTGSGCSTVAELLSSNEFTLAEKSEQDISYFSPPLPNSIPTSNEQRKYKICYNYLAANWTQAKLVKVTRLIMLLCLNGGFDNFLNQINKWIITDSFNSRVKLLQELKKKLLETQQNKENRELLNNLEKKLLKEINDWKDVENTKQQKKADLSILQKNIEKSLADFDNNLSNKIKQDSNDGLDKKQKEKLIKLKQDEIEKTERFKTIKKLQEKRNEYINEVQKIIKGKNKIAKITKEEIKKIEIKAKDVYLLLNRTQSYRKRFFNKDKSTNDEYKKEEEKCKENREKIEKFLEKEGELDNLYQKLKKGLDKFYVPTFQLFGNYIRYSSFFGKEDEDLERDNKKSHYSITNLLNHIIQFYRNINYDCDEATLIVIDALRNPYEISFLRKRYSSFYAMSIYASEEDRKKRLHKNYEDEVIDNFDETEYPSKKVSLQEAFVYQNIEKCTEMADIHIVNDNNLKRKKINTEHLKSQLVRYVSLMKHPGLVTPTHEERTMQIAFTAKYSSGCISRQVGAVTTDEKFAIKTIGWNTSPEGQVPCLLRDCYTLLNKGSNEDNLAPVYSDYEISQLTKDEKSKDKTFCDFLREKFDVDNQIFNGRNISYCFKDIYNLQTGKNNQVYARALHAEENAFLQIAKHGGQALKGGKLFTTASPCELCAKKAYQLGIKNIYYIDLYPGISQEHIIACGKEECRPTMHIFEGAIGRAYISLYQPVISYKDEINDILAHSDI